MYERASSPPAPNELMDRHEWHDNAEAQVAYAHQNGTPVSVLFADINLFKLVNDTLGHDVGDDVIDTTKQLAGELASVLRTGTAEEPGDMISLTHFDPEKAEQSGRLSPLEERINAYAGHLGGDEYGEIAETDEEGIRLIAGRLRKQFDGLIEKPEYAALKELGIGLSIGLSTLKPGMTASELLRAADEDAYEDKVRQLPPLSEKQLAAVRYSKAALEAEGMRLRDVVKYERLLNKIDQEEANKQS